MHSTTALLALILIVRVIDDYLGLVARDNLTWVTLWHANNTGADQPAHARSLVSTFVIHSLESKIIAFATRQIALF